MFPKFQIAISNDVIGDFKFMLTSFTMVCIVLCERECTGLMNAGGGTYFLSTDDLFIWFPSAVSTILLLLDIFNALECYILSEPPRT